jgi:hypothetical protein
VQVERNWLLTRSAETALRVRPGDRPQWIDLSAEAGAFPAWRAAAETHRLPVDAVLALLLEWSTVVATGGIDIALLSVAAAHDARAPRLAPTDDLRAWERQLAGRGPRPDADELPEASVPARVVAALGHPLDVTGRIDLTALPSAVLADRAAARSGLTVETWALRTALRIRA